MTRVLQVVHRVITRYLLGQAGLEADEADEADSGAVTLIQRFGSAANLNIHLHCLVLDRVYRHSADSTPEFVAVAAPTDEALQTVLHKIITRTMKLLTRRGYWSKSRVRLAWPTTTQTRTRPARSGRCRLRRGLAGRAGPVARPLARHKQSTGLFVSGLSLSDRLRSSGRPEGVDAARCNASGDGLQTNAVR